MGVPTASRVWGGFGLISAAGRGLLGHHASVLKAAPLHLFFLSMAPGYAPQSLSTRSEYQLDFRILNWNVGRPDPTSSEYMALLRDVQDKVWPPPPIAPCPGRPSLSPV